MTELLSYLAIPKRAKSIARFLALCIAEDCEAGEARILPSDVLFASDQQVDLWPSPDQTLRRRAADCVGLVRILGAVDGAEVGCVPSPGVGFHVFLVGTHGEIIDPCVARGMVKPKDTFYHQTSGFRVRIARPLAFKIGREVAGRILMEAAHPGEASRVVGTAPRARLPVGGIATAPLSLLEPIIKATIAASPSLAASVRMLASALTELHSEARFRASLADAVAEISARAAAVRAKVTGLPKGSTQPISAGSYDIAVVAVHTVSTRPDLIPQALRSANALRRAALVMARTVVVDLQAQGVLTPEPSSTSSRPVPLEADEVETDDEESDDDDDDEAAGVEVETDDDDDDDDEAAGVAPAGLDVEVETDEDDDDEAAGVEVETDEDDDDDDEAAGVAPAGLDVEVESDEDDDDEAAGVEVETDEDDEEEAAGVEVETDEDDTPSTASSYTAPSLLPASREVEAPPGCPGSCGTTY